MFIRYLQCPITSRGVARQDWCFRNSSKSADNSPGWFVPYRPLCLASRFRVAKMTGRAFLGTLNQTFRLLTSHTAPSTGRPTRVFGRCSRWELFTGAAYGALCRHRSQAGAMPCGYRAAIHHGRIYKPSQVRHRKPVAQFAHVIRSPASITRTPTAMIP
jgi:hypothetical protein